LASLPSMRCGYRVSGFVLTNPELKKTSLGGIRHA
jgi:hypothetical protein